MFTTLWLASASRSIRARTRFTIGARWRAPAWSHKACPKMQNSETGSLSQYTSTSTLLFPQASMKPSINWRESKMPSTSQVPGVASAKWSRLGFQMDGWAAIVNPTHSPPWFRVDAAPLAAVLPSEKAAIRMGGSCTIAEDAIARGMLRCSIYHERC